MNLSGHFPKSPSDSSWVELYISKMGESEFWAYRERVYDFLDRLQVGQWVTIEKMTEPETVDLFMKIAYCYVTESSCCYAFKNDYSQIKRYFDARQMEITLAIFKRKREEKNTGGDGSGTQSSGKGTEVISAQPQVVPDRRQ